MSKFPKQLLEDPSGFPTLGPAEAIQLSRMLNVIRGQYELAGYSPIETPLVERPDVLFAKAEGDITKQVYGLRLMNPDPESSDDSKDLALRFDQTVPLARFVAANHGKLSFPLRRYAIGPVFRGERPKDGRYRQFIQADIDVIGDGSLNLLHDAEMVGIISGVFQTLAIGPFTVRISNRKVLEGLLSGLGFIDQKQKDAARVIDKIEKDGLKRSVERLVQIGASEERAREFLAFLTQIRTSDETISALKKMSLGEEFTEGVKELEVVLDGIRQLKVPDKNFILDISIARDLSYYTGTVYETRLDKHPDLGSIASGGRFENLAGLFTEKRLPGVGISIGVTRLLLRLIKAGLIDSSPTTIAPVMVTTADDIEEFSNIYLSQASELRQAGIATEIYLARKDLGKQMQFASRRGFTIVVIARKAEIETETVVVRNLKTGDQKTVSSTELVTTVQEML